MADTAPGSTASEGTASGSTAGSGEAPQGTTPQGAAPASTAAGPSLPPMQLWLWAHTLARFGIAAVLIVILWAAGIGIWAAALFGLLLSMPIAYVVLRPIRERLATAVEVRREMRAVAKQELRTRLQGDQPD